MDSALRTTVIATSHVVSVSSSTRHGNVFVVQCEFHTSAFADLFNHLNGTMFTRWFLDDYIGGSTGLGHPDIDGFFFDVRKRAHQPIPGCIVGGTELQHC